MDPQPVCCNSRRDGFAQVSLKEAARLNTQALAEPATSTKKVADKGWDAVAADFLKSRGDRRSSTPGT